MFRTSSTGSDADTSQLVRKRGLGPFTGGQLTSIIIAVLVALALPVGAWAVVNSNVAITDPGGVNRAKVNTAGQLQTTAAVTGSVTATRALPGSMFAVASRGFIEDGFDSQALLLSAPAGKAYVITSVTLALGSAPATPQIELVLRTAHTGSCTTTPKDIGVTDIISGHNQATLTYDTGVPIANGRGLCLVGANFGASFQEFVDFTINGYYVPSAQCVSPNVCY